VHYYFSTMDDLFLQMFQRRADAGLELLRDALKSRPTLRQLWDLRETSVTSSRFNLEFMALANHRKAIRSAITDYYRRYRQLQLDAFTAALTDLGITPEQCPPLFAQLAVIGLTQIMTIDVELGVASDYNAVESFINEQIERIGTGREQAVDGSGALARATPAAER
jgi:AcrR family transcriptional regulator